VRVFPVKAYAFVNYADIGSAIKAMQAVDGLAIPQLTGAPPTSPLLQPRVPACLRRWRLAAASLQAQMQRGFAAALHPDFSSAAACRTVPYLQV
jgi:hypothetical protein